MVMSSPFFTGVEGGAGESVAAALADVMAAAEADGLPEHRLHAVLDAVAHALGACRASAWAMDGDGEAALCLAAVLGDRADVLTPTPADWSTAATLPAGSIVPAAGRDGVAVVPVRAPDPQQALLLLEGTTLALPAAHLVVRLAAQLSSAAVERGRRAHAEARLRDREHLLADIENVAGLGIWEWEIGTGRIVWSDRQCRIHGIVQSEAPADFAGFLEFVHRDDRARVIAECEELLRTGTPFHFHYRMLRRDGADRWLSGHGRVLRDEAGQPRRMIGTVQDITEVLAAEEALRMSEESYRTIFELAGDAMFVHDPKTAAVLDANRSACALHGVTLDQLKERGIPGVSDGSTPFDAEHAIERVRLAAAGEPQRFEWLGTHTDGRRVWVEVTLNRATILGQERVIASVRNVSERKVAEEALQRAYAELERRVEERTEALAGANRALESEIAEHRRARHALQHRTDELEALFQALPDIYLRIAGDGTVSDFRFGIDAQLYPIPDLFPAQLIGVRILDHMPPPLRIGMAETIAEVQRTGRVVCVEYPLPVRGALRHFETRIAPMPDDGVICVIRDITERTESAAALALAKEESEHARAAAEQANRAKSEFLSRMSHELRTPMNSILGFAQVLDGARLPDRHDKSVHHILRAGRHLLQLINEVLEIARIEAGRHNFSLEPVAIAPALDEALAMLRPLAAQVDVRIEDAVGVTDDLFVQADRQRLVQVLLNLLSNAIKYNVRGGHVRVSREHAAADRLVLHVVDTGPGIAPDRVDQLFTPFARLGAETSPVEGTGLGLVLSQRLTEAMGGRLRLERTGPGGTTFALELAAAPHPLVSLEERAPRRDFSDSAPHGAATLLYVEDNLANLTLVETILEARPRWRTLPALEGLIGLELAREHTPDLILLDLHLPDIAGEEVLRRLRADARTSHIPVVVISADATPSTIERLLTVGAAAFLTKPIDIDEFMTAVETLLPESATGR
jgi:PAS domain S-box-containing protein